MNRYLRLPCCVLLLICLSLPGLSQGSLNYEGGLKISLNETGSKYLRFLTWHQMWATTQAGESGSWETDFLLTQVEQNGPKKGQISGLRNIFSGLGGRMRRLGS